MLRRVLVSIILLGGGMFLADDLVLAQAHTRGVETNKATGSLQPGEYYWRPELSPSGPVVVLVSLPDQTLNAYRNGILVARSSISSGAKGRATPTGVFTILQKKREHYSNLYNNAPMPNMQRLTWQGIAMHSGHLPGYPASHGCIRMPYDFSKHLFTLTTMGSTVVIADDTKPQPHFALDPGLLLAPKDFGPEMLKALGPGEYRWAPERSSTGPVTVLLSAADKAVYVYRNGDPIGRAAIEIDRPGKPVGGHVFTLLNRLTGKTSPLAPGRPEREWMTVKTDSVGSRATAGELARRIRINPEFAQKVYDLLAPGATIVVTDAPAVRKTPSGRDFVILAD